MTKVTMKILDRIHRKLQIAKGMLGAKTLGDTIEQIVDDFIERSNRKR